MALHITNPEVELKVRELASVTGESITDAIGRAVAERMARVGAGRQDEPTVEEVLGLARSFGLEPIHPELTEDEILGYGSRGYSE